MAAAVTHRAQAPDGSIIEFLGPPDMTDDQVLQRAQQEYAVKTGAIPTTYRGGVQQSAGDTLAAHGSDLGMALGLGGAVTGQPEITAAAPMVGRAIKAGGQYLAGRKVDVPSTSELAVLAGEGALAGYGPRVLENFAQTTVAHPSSITGNYVKGVSGSGVTDWMARTAGEAAHAVAKSPMARSALVALPAQVRQYIMDKLNAAGAP